MKPPIPRKALDDRLGFIGTSGCGKTYYAGTARRAAPVCHSTRITRRIGLRTCSLIVGRRWSTASSGDTMKTEMMMVVLAARGEGSALSVPGLLPEQAALSPSRATSSRRR
ncbi:hypothetical protein J6525_41985 [Bradyrhizobium sp. WSM 4400]|nr:hypothetical protein [Bradyrhizobium australafricanum]